MTKTKTYLILFAFFYLHAAQAQTGNPPTPDGIPNGAPVDGGIIALLAAGGAMGYKKLKVKRNDTTE